jgi:hypothetical protein
MAAVVKQPIDTQIPRPDEQRPKYIGNVNRETLPYSGLGAKPRKEAPEKCLRNPCDGKRLASDPVK